MAGRPDTSPDPTWRRARLILVGHGSAHHPDSATPTRELAEIIAARGLFQAVRCAFWRQRPSLQEVLADAALGDLYVVPNFAGAGLFTDQLIPQTLGLAPGQSTTRRPGGRLVLTPPLGSHPAVPGLIAQRVGEVVAAHRLDPSATGLLLIAHGSRRPGGSGATANALVETLRRTGRVAEVAAAFLEQEPAASDWPHHLASPNILVLPLLIARGYHGSGDMAALFDLDPATLKAASAPLGPLERQGRRLWIIPTITDPATTADLVLDLVRQSANKGALPP
ncbi:CbiX/SirB N-terminal domain-containing protein [Roseospirillum parvum]|uniref:Sirohydrochlorin cobaltochelatase n=1 Tax=Roseospirillum parvum TaxID=83401 RepID=A0A1G8BW18_9PROT|nr:CbiX/SirB N-terminal domain-containing protein [Roseospirillum parvum]SDH37381.1 sirohydrochlorin cobaltochelatase [Roseospirillum parvum]